DRAYWDLRRQRVTPHLKRRLANNGRGTRIEIDPVDQRNVQQPHRRDLAVRHINVRPRIWNAAVDAWLNNDDQAMEGIWDEIIMDLGSGYDAYTNVASVGWAA
ncbi:transcriptional regulator, partial [Streptomyces sp. ACA25]|nr:transcriptional regulator [Streptomyces sp. ACA25]